MTFPNAPTDRFHGTLHFSGYVPEFCRCGIYSPSILLVDGYVLLYLHHHEAITVGTIPIATIHIDGIGCLDPRLMAGGLSIQESFGFYLGGKPLEEDPWSSTDRFLAAGPIHLDFFTSIAE